MDASPEPEPLDERLDRSDESAGDEELRVRVRREQRGEGLEPELEPVRLVLVAPEEECRPALGRALARREMSNVDRVVEDLPRPGRFADPLVGRPLAELALVEDVLGRPEDESERSVDRVRVRACPARVADAVLVEEERNPPAPRVPEERPKVARQPGRSEIENREVGRVVRKPRRQALELRRAARDRLAGGRHVVVAVEHPHAWLRSSLQEEP